MAATCFRKNNSACDFDSSRRVSRLVKYRYFSSRNYDEAFVLLYRSIQSLSTKICSLDSLPTFVRKNYADLLPPLITEIVNRSMTTGNFPSFLKLSHVRPRLQKGNINLDKEILKNYRPVAKIPFLSKVIKKVVVTTGSPSSR